MPWDCRGARDLAAKGRSSLGRSRWPDAKITVTCAICDLRSEQKRERREQRRERREKREESREGRRGGLPKDRPQGGQREDSRAKSLNMRAPPMQCWRLAIVKYVRDSVDP